MRESILPQNTIHARVSIDVAATLEQVTSLYRYVEKWEGFLYSSPPEITACTNIEEVYIQFTKMSYPITKKPVKSMKVSKGNFVFNEQNIDRGR